MKDFARNLIACSLLACADAEPETRVEIPRPVPGAQSTAEEQERLDTYYADCTTGTARGCAALGQVHLDGAWVKQDRARAREYYEAACRLGERCSKLGVLLYRGWGGPEDPARALALWQDDCQKGVVDGCAQEGVAHQRGIGTVVDLPLARARFRQACTGQHAMACANLGYLLQGGEGGPRDSDAAREAYATACGLGEQTGCNNLGLLAPPLSEPVVLSPAPASSQHTAPIPVGIAVPGDFAAANVAMWLDNTAINQDDVTIREGRTPRGDGAMILATLRNISAGEHTLRVRLEETSTDPVEISSSFTFEPKPCVVSVMVRDPTGAPLNARVIVEDRRGPVNLSALDAAKLDTMGRDATLHSLLVHDGVATLFTEPGWHRLTAVRSIREGVDEWEGALCEEDGRTEVTLTLSTEVPTPNTLLADLHVHTALSGDAFVPHGLRADSIRSAGLDAFVLTDHDHVTDPAVLAVEGGLAGAEITLQAPPPAASGGHLNVFPLPPSKPVSPSGAPSLNAVVALGGESGVVQINHPRGIQFSPENPSRTGAHALFNHTDFKPSQPSLQTPLWRLLSEIEAIEVVNRFSWDRYLAVREDWFALLSAGFSITGTGNSDSHGLALEQIGLPVNLIHAATADEVPEAVRRGHVTVSTGPIIDFAVETEEGTAHPGDTVELPTGRVTLQISVRAAAWVPVDEVRIIQNGDVIHRERVSEKTATQRLTLTLPLDITVDSWLLAEAGQSVDARHDASSTSNELYQRVAPGYTPLSFTNPVWLRR